MGGRRRDGAWRNQERGGAWRSRGARRRVEESGARRRTGGDADGKRGRDPDASSRRRTGGAGEIRPEERWGLWCPRGRRRKEVAGAAGPIGRREEKGDRGGNGSLDGWFPERQKFPRYAVAGGTWLNLQLPWSQSKLLQTLDLDMYGQDTLGVPFRGLPRPIFRAACGPITNSVAQDMRGLF
jgi:hypothetical protein